MNAHQRRIQRRRKARTVTVIFDLEAIAPQWGFMSSIAIMGDFTGIEDRVIAYGGGRSGGKGIDIRRQKAAEIFNVQYEDVTPEQRAAGKNANYLDWYRP